MYGNSRVPRPPARTTTRVCLHSVDMDDGILIASHQSMTVGVRFQTRGQNIGAFRVVGPDKAPNQIPD